MPFPPRPIGVVLLLLLAPSAPADEGNEFGVQLERLIGDVAKAADKLTDYTCTFTKQEHVGGALRPPDTMLLKQSKSLGCVYMKWTGGPHSGRETIYCRERYGGRLQVHEGGGVASWFGALSLDPHGTTAMRGERHPITEAGVFYTVDMMRRSFARERGRPEPSARRGDVHEEDVEGQPSVCASIAPGEPSEASGYGTANVELCSHRTLHLPTRVRVWDPDGKLAEHYTYRDYQLNPGLTATDFDTANREYGF